MRTTTSVLWTLIMLTQLDGNPVWVESTAIVIVKGSHTGYNQQRQCGHGAGSAIRVGGIGFCVKETAEQVREKIKGAK